jgi:hypothetical protein
MVQHDIAPVNVCKKRFRYKTYKTQHVKILSQVFKNAPVNILLLSKTQEIIQSIVKLIYNAVTNSTF